MTGTRPRDSLFAIHATMCRLEYLLAGAPEDDGVSFGYVPLPLEDFFTGLAVVEAYVAALDGFLDLGCGAGTKLSMLHHLGWKGLAGVEINPRLATLAGQLNPESTIAVGDAFDVDCSGHRVVYSYRLCQDDDRQRELGEHIADTADPGTLVFYPRARFPRGEHLAASVWRLS